MQKHNLNQLLEYDDERFCPKVLLHEPGYRMLLLSMRARQSIPEHTVQGIVTVYAMLGRVSFYAGSCPCDLHAGELVCFERGLLHRIEAQDDSVLLVLITDDDGSSQVDCEVLDLREVRRSECHPLVFHKSDMPAVGRSFTLTNDPDPVPSSGQMNHVQPGPDTFCVRIRRFAAPDRPQRLCPDVDA